MAQALLDPIGEAVGMREALRTARELRNSAEVPVQEKLAP
jgi:hypothetical protein